MAALNSKWSLKSKHTVREKIQFYSDRYEQESIGDDRRNSNDRADRYHNYVKYGPRKFAK